MARQPSRKRKQPRNPLFEEDPVLGILVTAKRVGLTREDLAFLTLDDFTMFVDMWVGDEGDGARRATQDDIDSMLG